MRDAMVRFGAGLGVVALTCAVQAAVPPVVVFVVDRLLLQQ